MKAKYFLCKRLKFNNIRNGASNTKGFLPENILDYIEWTN
jgi:hypothetical protein